jgi:predicted transcriptional regulator
MSGSPQLKQRVLDVMDTLPADATIEDAIERLVFLAKVERGLAQVTAGQGIPHDEIVKRFSQ